MRLRGALVGLTMSAVVAASGGCGSDDTPSSETPAGAAEIFYSAFLNHYELGRMRERDWEALSRTSTRALLLYLRRGARNVPADNSGAKCTIRREAPRALTETEVVVAAVHDCGGQRVVGLGFAFAKDRSGDWRVSKMEDVRNADEKQRST